MKRISTGSKNIFAAVAMIALMPIIALAGPRVAVMGDSYSTYNGTMPSGYATYYPAGDVNAQSKQYWAQFIAHIEGELCQNNSWSGSFLAARGVHQSFVDSRRIETLVGSNPDIIVICGGTNDAWGSDGNTRVEVGEEQYADWTDDDLKKFFPAYTYLICEIKKSLPDVEIVIVANSCDDYVNSGNTHRDVGIPPAYCEAMEKIADHYGLCFVQCAGVEKSNYHPTAAGFATMATQLNAAWDEYQKFKHSKARSLTPVAKEPAATMPLSNTVEPMMVNDGFVYVFTDTSAPINLTLDAAATLTRALIVGGGGAGGNNCGGGGGAGGFIELDWSANPIALAENAEISLQVGAGGVAAATAGPGGNGGSSLLTVGGTTYTAVGGGSGGGGYSKGDNLNGRDGGSGGGGGGGYGQAGSGGSASNSEYGNAGGTGTNASYPYGGGGGGAETAGANAGSSAGAGGAGKSSSITGDDVVYAGGGGGGFASNVATAGASASGGIGGGGRGAGGGLAAESGTDGLGGGGGGGGGGNVPGAVGNGGSGTVILRFYDDSATAYPEATALIAATNSPTAMEIDVTLASVGAEATEATVYFKYGIESVEEHAALLGTLVTGATGHYVVDGLQLETTYQCEIIVSNNAATVHSVTLAGTIATMPVAAEMKPVIELTKPVATATTASFNLSVSAIGEGAASAAVDVRLDVDGVEGAWTTLAAAVQEGYQYAVALADLDEGASYRYLVRVENDLGLSAIATNEFVAAAGEPSREDGRSITIGERIQDGEGKVVGLRLKLGYAGHVFGSSVLYAAYGAEDGGETTNGWDKVECVAEIAAATRTYDYILPAGWGATVTTIRFFLDSDAMLSINDYATDGLVAQWDAIDNGGEGVHNDTTATWVNLRDGNFNMTYASGAATFTANGFTSGTSHFASPSELAWWQALGNDYTFEASVTPAASLGTSATLMGSGGNSNPYSLFCQKNANDWGFYEMTNVGIGDVSLSANVIAHDGETRTQLAYVVSPGGTKVYGVLAGEKAATMPVFANAAPFWVGAGYEANRRFAGSIHAVRVYSRSLSADEIAANAETDDLRFAGEEERVMSASEVYIPEGDEPSVMVSVTPKRFAATLNIAVPYLGTGAASAAVYSRVKDAANWDLVADSIAAGYVGVIELEGLEEGTDYAYEIRVVNNLAVEVVQEVEFSTKLIVPPFEVAYETGTYALSLAPAASGFSLGSVGLEDVLVFTGGVTRLYLLNDCTLTRALIVGGGGAGGGNAGGGGGAGGFIELDLSANPITLAAGEELTLTVGAGGSGSEEDAQGANGEDSVLTIGGTTYTAAGGGGGGSWSAAAGVAGGSGGGGAHFGSGGSPSGAGVGFAGGDSINAAQVSAGGGGGGAGASGGNSVATTGRDGGAGGVGRSSDLTGRTVFYAGGGGGGAVWYNGIYSSCGLGGAGGGGDGANLVNNDGRGKDGINGLGGGGGGAGGGSDSITPIAGGSGGSGTVILRILNPNVPHGSVAVAMATPETAWVNVNLVSAGSGATKADAYFTFWADGDKTAKGKVATLSAGGEKRFLLDGLTLGKNYAYELVVSNNAARVASVVYAGTFAAVLPELPVQDAARAIEIVATNATAATLRFGEKEYAGTLPLYVGYGDTASSESGTNGWTVVKKLADIDSATGSFVWEYPNGWGRKFRAARFFFFGEEIVEEVEFLQSNGSEYILTEVAAAQNLKIAGKVRFTDYVGLTGDKWWTVFGAYVGPGDGCCLFSYNGGGYQHLIFNDPQQVHDTITFSGGEICEFEAWSLGGTAYLKVNERQNSKASAYACSTGGNLPLFAMYNGGVNKTCNSRVPIYYFKMWEGATLKRDFIPVKKGGEGMLYDRVSGGFFQNASGAGSFTCGDTTNTMSLVTSSASAPLYFGSPMKNRMNGIILNFR